MGFLGNDLWLSGHELELGVKVLVGLFSASEAQSIMDFPSNSDTTYRDLPDFHMSRAMNILVHCTRRKHPLVITPLATCLSVLLRANPILTMP